MARPSKEWTLIGAGVAALTPAAWWLTSPLAKETTKEHNADYLWRPLAIPEGAKSAIGVTSLVLVVAAVVVLNRMVLRGRAPQGAMGVVWPLAAASTSIGVGYSVVTAPVIGANIGGGLAIMFGIPFVIVMVLIAAIRMEQLASRREHQTRA